MNRTWFDSPGIYIDKNTGKEILIERGYNEIMSMDSMPPVWAYVNYDSDALPRIPMTLHQLYDKHFKDGWPDFNTVHSYLPVYEEILKPYRHSARNVLEIGLFTGTRLKIWEEYFDADVYGIDCDEQPHGGMADLRPMIAEGTHNIYIGDAESEADIKKFFDGIKFDVIIEDASHQLSQQIGIYHNLKNYLAPNGIYIIEDIADIDFSRTAFEMIDPKKNIEILDRRQILNRFDDVLVIITDKK